jgi:hypothetical protein
MDVERGKSHERLASAALGNNGGGPGLFPSLHDSHCREALRREWAPQQTVESLRDGVVRRLESGIDFQDPFAQLLRGTV